MAPETYIALWFALSGALLVILAMSASGFRRLPLSTSMLYLVAGVAFGPLGLGLLRLHPLSATVLLEHVAEIAVIISLFTSGLKLRTPIGDRLWRVPVLLATVAMVLTVGLVTAVGVWGLGLPLGAAVLLGAVLAPTDPVLASDVQVRHAADREQVRFSLTGEAGLNDGTAFPFVMLGVGLLGLHELGTWGWRWWAVDLVWAIAGGLAIGAGCGWAVARLILYLRNRNRESVGTDDYLTLGLIAGSYGIALLLDTYGFLAVFAAGLALRNVERMDAERGATGEEGLDEPEHSPQYMAAAVLGFNEQLERLAEISVVVLLGSMLFLVPAPAAALWFLPVFFFVIRPLSVAVGLVGSGLRRDQRLLIAWFGVRGVGSVFYLMYAINHGLDEGVAATLTSLCLLTVAASIFLHGISVTPLMRIYGRRLGE
jgi:NhaP-type Na+/H+ or K+/H+ antiporter